MDISNETECTAFEGYRLIGAGGFPEVVAIAKRVIDAGAVASVLIFDNVTGEQLDVDYRGTEEEVLQRVAARMRFVAPTPVAEPDGEAARRGPGRPRLGVEAHEVTLLPRHWEWLNSQPGGASVALRKLVEHARKANEGKDRIRRAQESAYRFMHSLAGNLPWFEEASRALFAANRERFTECTESWPEDVRAHARFAARDAFVGVAE